MIRSLYLSGTNMIVQRRRMDVVTNNIANVETAGYKSDKLLSRSFADMMLSRVGDPAVLSHRTEVGPLNTGSHIDEVITNFDQGHMSETGKLTDVGIASKGFFVISTPDGDRYTRDGSFHFDKDGYLRTSDGYNVMGENGIIQVENPDQGFTIEVSGVIRDAQDDVVAKFRVVDFEKYEDLRKVGNNRFINYTDQAVQNVDDYEVRQGYLEASNVQVGFEMVDMMQLYRSYETSQRFVKMVDETLQKSVNEVGRV